MDDLISRQVAIDTFSVGKEMLNRVLDETDVVGTEREKFSFGLGLIESAIKDIEKLPSAQPEIIQCKDCKHWRQQTNYQGAPLSFGFCESDDMWRSLYGETYEVSHIDTDDDFYCGYAERRTDGGLNQQTGGDTATQPQ